MKKTRILAVLLAFGLFFSVALSLSSLGLNAGHECLPEENCAVCAEMNACKSFLEQLGTAVVCALAVLVAAAAFTLFKSLLLPILTKTFSTPVLLKDKLLN